MRRRQLAHLDDVLGELLRSDQLLAAIDVEGHRDLLIALRHHRLRTAGFCGCLGCSRESYRFSTDLSISGMKCSRILISEERDPRRRTLRSSPSGLTRSPLTR